MRDIVRRRTARARWARWLVGSAKIGVGAGLLLSLAALPGCGSFATRGGALPGLAAPVRPGCEFALEDDRRCGVGPEYHPTEWFSLAPDQRVVRRTEAEGLDAVADAAAGSPNESIEEVRELAAPPRWRPPEISAGEVGAASMVAFPEPQWPAASPDRLPDVTPEDVGLDRPTEDAE